MIFGAYNQVAKSQPSFHEKRTMRKKRCTLEHVILRKVRHTSPNKINLNLKPKWWTNSNG